MLLLEGRDANHPTQSRFSRFAVDDSDMSNTFGVASRMFRNSSAGYSPRPSHIESSVQQTAAAADASHGASFSTSQSRVPEGQDTLLAGQHHQQELDPHNAENSLSGSAGSYQFHGSDQEMSSHSYRFVQQSQISSAVQADSRTHVSSSAGFLQHPQLHASSPEASANSYQLPDTVGLEFSQGLAYESPHHDSMLQDVQSHGEMDESNAHYTWSAQSQSYASSAASPGRDSLHCWTDSTPIRAPVPQDPASPDARTILRSIARECQHAVEGKSPAVRVNTSGLSPQSRPDLGRTPNTFFNPSFDADKSP